MEIPQRHARRQLRLPRDHVFLPLLPKAPLDLLKGGRVRIMAGQLDRLHFQVSKVRHLLRAVAHHHEFDLGEDEAVPTAVLAHVAVQVGEAAQVLHLAVVALHAHARVPAIKGLDQSHHATESAAIDELRGVVGVVGDEGGIGGGLGGAHDEVAGTEGEGEGGVELGGVEGVVDALELGLGLGLRGGSGGDGQGPGRQVDAEQGVQAGDGADGGGREGGPGPDLSDIPPEMPRAGVAHVEVELAHERRRGVRCGQIGHQRRGLAVVEGAEAPVRGQQTAVRPGRGRARGKRVDVRGHEGLGLGVRRRRHVRGQLPVGREAVLLEGLVIQIRA